jgi:hypothetical protein
MRIIVRIPLNEWAVKHLIHTNRHRLEPDGITIQQTAKDLIGKLVTGYMRKTIFDAWSMAIPSESHLRISLPVNYSRYGLTAQDLVNLSDMLTDLAQREICREVALIASMPGISRAMAIREVFVWYGISDEEYDQGHFRRYFDRYSKGSLGAEFPEFRKEITRTLKEIYGPLVGAFLEGEQ